MHLPIRSELSVRLQALLILVVLPVAGCTDATVTSFDDTASLDTAFKSDVPLALSGAGGLESQVFAPDFGPPVFGRSTFEGRCAEPSDYVARFSAGGEGTHVGQFTAALEHCGLIDFAAGTSTDRDGVLIVTAADGAELHGTYTCDPISGPSFECQGILEGGTGRFEGAVGEAVISGRTDRSTGTIPEFHIAGSLVAFDAGSRRAQHPDATGPQLK